MKTLQLGEDAPDFQGLVGVDGKKYSLSSFKAKPVLAVLFTCNHCPYAKAYEDRLLSIQNDYSKKGVQIVAINSNDAKTHPEDSYNLMVKRAEEKGFNFPYLRDEDQSAVDSYGAVCTPHIFVFDGSRHLRYRGRIDDSKDPNTVKVHDLRKALDDMVAGKPVRVSDTQPFGCSIKWYVK